MYIKNADFVIPNIEKHMNAIINAITKATSLPNAVLIVSFFVGCIVNIATIPAEISNSKFNSIASSMAIVTAKLSLIQFIPIFFNGTFLSILMLLKIIP